MNKKYLVNCDICHHRCKIALGAYGFCGIRQNLDGKLVNQGYGKITALALDPIEKKPLYRFYPGSAILSVGSLGCNMNCSFCQNHHIARLRLDSAESNSVWESYTPKALVELAIETKKQGNRGLAFTYNEPLINYEFIIDCAKKMKEMDSELKVVLVTNGHLEIAHAKKLLPYVDAANIDLKAFRKAFYTKMGGDFSLVKAFIEEAVKNCHVELCYLLIPGLNDGLDEVEEAAQWIASLDCTGQGPLENGKDIALHISRFFPTYKLVDRAATSVSAVYEAVAVAKKHLNWVYPGNV